MSNRVTEKQLEAIVNRINMLTKSPLTAYTKMKNGKYKANIRNFHLSYAYGGVSLHRMVNKSGGVEDIFRSGHVSKRDLANRMWAYIDGLVQDETK